MNALDCPLCHGTDTLRKSNGFHRDHPGKVFYCERCGREVIEDVTPAFTGLYQTRICANERSPLVIVDHPTYDAAQKHLHDAKKDSACGYLYIMLDNPMMTECFDTVNDYDDLRSSSYCGWCGEEGVSAGYCYASPDGSHHIAYD